MRRNQTRFLVAASILLTAAPVASFAADIKAGRQKAMQCSVCHGRDGIAVNPDAPNLAGESAIYIEKQLKAFRSGERQNEQMTIMAKDLSDADIADLAAWYQAMKVSVTLPDVK